LFCFALGGLFSPVKKTKQKQTILNYF